MEKVKVSKEVAEVLEGTINYSRYKNIISFMTCINRQILDEVHSSETSKTWLERHNLTNEDLINAYKYGWEVEYEFQVGDIVLNHEDKLISVNDVGLTNTLSFINNNRSYFKLVCKAENREDLK